MSILRLAGLFTPRSCAFLLRLRTCRDFVSRRSAYTPHPCVRPAPARQTRVTGARARLAFRFLGRSVHETAVTSYDKVIA